MKVLSVDGLSKLITLMKEEFASSSSLSTVATSGSYNDLSNKPTIPTIDQTYNASSSNAQSGVAINGAGFLKNTATGTNSITILGSACSTTGAMNIGELSSVGLNGSGSIAIGGKSNTNGSSAIAIGYESRSIATNSIAIGYEADAREYGSIQLGIGTNSTAGTLYVGLQTSSSSSNNYKLLGSDGKIPDDRLNTTIARTSQIPSASDLLPSQSGNSGKFLTTNGTTVSWATVTQPSIATTSTAGLIKPDGTTITITNDGTISASSSSITFRTWSV